MGVAVSMIAQFTKGRLTEAGTLALVLFLSVGTATIYYFLQQNESWYWAVMEVLTIAGAFHNYIIRRFK